jgi:hypothetical protein
MKKYSNTPIVTKLAEPGKKKASILLTIENTPDRTKAKPKIKAKISKLELLYSIFLRRSSRIALDINKIIRDTNKRSNLEVSNKLIKLVKIINGYKNKVTRMVYFSTFFNKFNSFPLFAISY